MDSFCDRHEDCAVDFSNFIINCAFIALSICTILWIISKKLSLKNHEGNTFQEHNSRWILFIILLLICLSEVADAFIMTENTGYRSNSLKLPSIFSLLAALTAAFFYSKMEKWNALKPLFLLLIYWPVIIATKIFKLGHLYHSGLHGHHLTVTITLCYLVVYLLSFLVEINLVWTNKYLSSWQSIALPLNDPPDTQYRRPWVSLPSKATFHWMNALIWHGLKRPITQQCLGSLTQEFEIQGHFNKFKEIYSTQSIKRREASQKSNKTTTTLSPSLWKCFAIFLWRPILLGAFLKFVADLMSFVAPLSVGIIVSFIVTHHYSSPKELNHVTVSDFFKNGYVMACIVLVLGLTRTIFTHNLTHLTNTLGIRVRCVVQMLVYEKSLKLSVWPKETQVADADEIRCLVTDDANNLMRFIAVFHYIWSFFFKMLILTLLLYLQLGYGAIIGVFVTLLFLLPAQFQLRKIMGKSQIDAQTIKKGRLSKMEELLRKMLCLKMNSWEIFFAHKIRHIRQRESHLLLLISFCWWLHDVLTWAALVLMSVVAFSVYTSAEREILTPQAAFTAVALFGQILFCLFISPALISISINAVTSLKRLQKFLATPEFIGKRFNDLEPEGSTVLEFEDDSGSVVLRIRESDVNERPERSRDTEIFLSESDEDVDGDSNAAIQLEEATFSWDQTNKEPVLRDLSINIPIGKITLVCSHNRNSERAFLLALLGELYTLNGSIKWTRNSPIAYVPFTPWLQRTSIRNNILFGTSYNEQRYNRIVSACSLQNDFDDLSSGDLSIVDDEVELSASQKHRISIARALYSKCKTIILDDVFPQMDSLLSLHVFEEGLRKLALHYRRTVIAVCRQTHILPMADLIVLLEDKSIKFHGNWRQLQERGEDLPSTVTENFQPEDDFNLNQIQNQDSSRIPLAPALKISSRGILQMLGIYIDEPATISTTQLLNSTVSDLHNTTITSDLTADADASDVKLMPSKEKKKSSNTTLNILLRFAIQHCGWLFLVSLGLLLVATHLLLAGRDIWLSTWSNEWQKHGEDEYSGHYLTLYNVISILAVINLCAAGVVASVAAVRTFASFYNSVVDAILSYSSFSENKINDTMQFLRVTFAELDHKIPIIFHYLWFGLLCVIITFITFGVSMFMFLLALLFIAFITFFQRMYNKFYRNLYVISITSMQETFSHLNESLKGLMLIRSFSEEKNFLEQLIILLNTNQLITLIVDSSRRWMEIIVEIAVSLVIFIVSVVAIKNGLAGSLQPGVVGLSIAYVLMLPIFLHWLIASWPELRSDVNVLKTVDSYTRKAPEENQGTMITEWPSSGKIQVENLSLPSILNEVSFLINPGEKVGIYDRNGSDLLPVAYAFVRLTNISEGSIIIDDSNIADVMPVLLRLRIAIISRDDYIFKGTIRTNLDMKGSFSDDELWTVLRSLNIKNTVSSLTDGLDSELSSESRILTTQEFQLLCLGRAILRKPKIIITNDLDATFLKLVFDTFPSCSAIALSTEAATLTVCDRVLALDNGHMIA